MIAYLIHDLTMQMAMAITAKVNGDQMMFAEIYDICKAALIRYEEKSDRAHTRANPR